MPKQPPAAETLALWLKPEFREDLAEFDGVDVWRDYSGNHFDMEQSDPDLQPRYLLRRRWGAPALEFGPHPGIGTPNTYLEGAFDFDDVITSKGAWTIMLAFYAASISIEQMILCDTTGANGRIQLKILSTGELRALHATASGNEQVDIGDPLGTDPFKMSIGWHVACVTLFGGFFYIFLDDPLYYKRVASGSTLALSALRLGLDPSDTIPFDEGLIPEVVISDAGWTDANRGFMHSYFSNRYLDTGNPLERMRNAGSRRLNFLERPRQKGTMHLPLGFINRGELYTPHALTHEFWPSPTGEGAGFDRPDRAVVVPTRVREVGDDYLLDCTLEDQRGLAHQYRETGIASRNDDPRREGVKISGVGVYRFPVAGTTPVWVDSPSGEVVEVPAGVEAGEPNGIVCEPATNQYLLRSSFQSQLTGWTIVGDGVNGSDIQAQDLSLGGGTVVHLFDLAVTQYCALFIAGSPTHDDDLYIEGVTTADELIQALQRLCASFDRYEVTAGAVLDFAIQEDVNGEWWDDTNESWDPSLVWNEMSAVALGFGRSRSNVIVWPNGIGQATVRVGFRAGGTAGRMAQLFHSQLE